MTVMAIHKRHRLEDRLYGIREAFKIQALLMRA